MKNTLFQKVLKKYHPDFTSMVVISCMLLGCASNKKVTQESDISGLDNNIIEPWRIDNNKSLLNNLDLDDHGYISLNSEQKLVLSNNEDSLEQLNQPVGNNSKSRVAHKIVENYLASENKEPNGHCLAVSKSRFEQAYKEIYGHSVYRDLPEFMATKNYTSKQVFNLLYASASDTQPGWKSLPEIYRGKGNAGALAYAGMGTLVDSLGIWSGKLQPGALMQVWRFKADYEQVVQGVNVAKLDPYGHSFIFISYVYNDKDEIIGLKIADQGFQSYRPLLPRDYEVWWAVNLTI